MSGHSWMIVKPGFSQFYEAGRPENKLAAPKRGTNRIKPRKKRKK